MALSRARPRIIAGRYRGRVLQVASGVRPTSARVREALMNIWQHVLPDAVLLDLFAGSGAIGIEALSRGAARVVFVERDALAVRLLRETVHELDGANLDIVEADLPSPLAARLGFGFLADLAFADPPYAFTAYEKAISQMEPLLAETGQLAIEHDVRVVLPREVGRLKLTGRRDYGDSSLSFYEFSSD